MGNPACIALKIQDGGPLEVPVETLLQRIERVAAADPDAEVCIAPGESPGQPETRTWAQWLDETKRLAAGLRELGVEPGDRVALLADPRPEWKALDWAIQALGAITVPIYTVLPKAPIAYILDDHEPKVLVVESGALESLAFEALQSTKVQPTVVRLAGPPMLARLPGKQRAAPPEGPAWPTAPTPFASLLAHEPVRELPAPDLSAPALIIYTSGTTGNPKGAALTLGNLVSSCISTREALSFEQLSSIRIVAFLPLAHVAGYMAIQAILDAGGVCIFSHPKRALDDLLFHRPTVLGSVPRMFERIVNKMHLASTEGSAVKRGLIQAAEKVAAAHGKALEDGGAPTIGLRLKVAVFERLVFKPLRTKLGFDRLEAGLIGAAAVRPDLLHFFQGIGVPVAEAYGLTETTAVAVANGIHDYRAGTVGRPVRGLSVAVDGEGEILCRGPQVFSGYWRRPAETADSFVEHDGIQWFRTGDIGEFGPDGRLSITDRAKELEILDTGKNVAPVVIEDALKQASPFVADALAIGHGRSHMAALILPDLDAMKAWADQQGKPHDASRDDVGEGPTGDKMTFRIGPGFLDRDDVQALFQGAVDAANQHLAHHEQVRRFALVDTVFTVERGEITPTFKKKRKAIRENHARLVDGLF